MKTNETKNTANKTLSSPLVTSTLIDWEAIKAEIISFKEKTICCIILKKEKFSADELMTWELIPLIKALFELEILFDELIINFENVRYIDVSGLECIEKIHTLNKSYGKPFLLYSLTDAPRRLIQVRKKEHLYSEFNSFEEFLSTI